MDDATAAVGEGDGDVVLMASGVAEAVGLAISVPLAEGGTVSVAEAAIDAAGGLRIPREPRTAINRTKAARDAMPTRAADPVAGLRGALCGFRAFWVIVC